MNTILRFQVSPGQRVLKIGCGFGDHLASVDPSYGLGIDFVDEPTVSIIVAARNETGHIAEIVKRVPEMGGGTELIFVEGHSTDETYQEIERVIASHPQKHCKLFRQQGHGKGDAVRLGFDQAGGDILMILDADRPYYRKIYHDSTRPSSLKKANLSTALGSVMLSALIQHQ